MFRKTALVSDQVHRAARTRCAGTSYGGSCLRLFDCRYAGTCHARVCVATSVFGVACGIRLAHWPKRKDDFLAPRRKIILYVSFFNKAHSGSSRPVAYLKGARLERSMDGWRRGIIFGLYLKHTR